LIDAISLHKPQNTFGIEELDAIKKVFESGWLTLGPKTVEFERVVSNFTENKYGVAASSCTSALYLALDSLNIKKGDFVVIPVNTFASTANVVRWIGAEPIFCEVGEDGEIDETELARILETNEDVTCVVPVHLYGFPCNMNEISRLTKKYNIKMIEDCAQALGATFGGKRVGGFGDVGCSSFYATKNISTGEGGMLVTNSKKVQNRALLVRNHGQTKTPNQKMTNWHYDISDLGFNFRMSEIEAAIGLKQMEKIGFITESRRELARKYQVALEEIEGIKMLHDPDDNLHQSVFQLLEVKVEKPYPLTRNQLYLHLQKKGITTGVHYIPLHYFSYYKKTTKYKKGDFPNAENLFSKILSLPMFPFMTDHEFQTIIEALKVNAF
jgi:dTDP-4-amino-4,6-dideoxygalactose transaminase